MKRHRQSTFVLTLALGLAFPGLASAAQTFSVGSPGGPATFAANSDASYTTSMTFDTSAGAPQTALITESPGVLASLAANPSCVQSIQHTPACEIGTGQASVLGLLPVGLTAYLVPATSPNDAAGIDLVSSGGTSHAEVQLKQNASGGISSVLNVDLTSLGPAGHIITGTTLTVNGTLGGKPFVRMPSNCSPGPSSLTVTYSSGPPETSAASPDFTITGCSSLPYNPRLSVTAVKDANDPGVAVTTTVTQNANEASTAGQTLSVPFPTLAPNFSSLSLQNSGIAVGSATAYSPLLPTPLVGNVYFTGPSPLAPTLTIRFPPPNSIVLVGTVNLQKSTLAFTGIPDVPQTKLVVSLFGGPKALESSNCTRPSGTFAGSFTGQNGSVVTASTPVTVQNCPAAAGVPTVSGGSLHVSAGGKPVLRFKLTKGTNAPSLKAFTVALPHALSFDATGLRTGLSVKGAKVSAKVHGRTLTVSLKGAAASVSVKLAGPLLVAKKHLHRAKLRITITDASGTSTTTGLQVG